MIYKRFILPLLKWRSRKDSEIAHEIVAKWLQCPYARLILRLWTRPFRGDRLEQKICGVTFPNPVGCAAGFDKKGNLVPGLAGIGFGFVEVGTVVPEPQEGNPRPRLFRLPKHKALINRMGFNSPGVSTVSGNLLDSELGSDLNGKVPIGISVGKNKETPLENASHDHETVIRFLVDFAAFVVVNVSSPNTPELRKLQGEKYIKKILQDVVRAVSSRQAGRVIPIFVKIAPDLTDEEIRLIIRVAKEVGIQGIIAANTTTERFDIDDSLAGQEGGLSGPLLFDRMCEIVKLIRNEWHDSAIIAVGGIDSPEKAIRVIHDGADLIQIYTALIYEGPQIVKKINQGILDHMRHWQFASIAEMRGRSYPLC